ncbi:MAG: hypothetical protein ACI3YC_02185 [Alloprevotella sp.]
MDSELENTNTQTSLEETTEQTPKKKKNKLVIGIIVVIVLLLIGGGVGFAVLQNSQSESERELFESLEGNENPEDYQVFLEKYPDSDYAPIVKEKLQELQSALEDWNRIALSERVADFEKFKELHADYAGFAHRCDLKIDSLDFVAAQKAGTPEAFAAYLEKHPDGRYASEASIAEGAVKEAEVTPEMKEEIIGVLTGFYSGFQEHDQELICSNITPTMTRFLGQSNVSKAKVLSTIEGMFTEDIEGVRFVMGRDVEVESMPAADQTQGDREFKVTFTVDQYIERNNEGKTFSSYKGEAILTTALLIRSLTMQELSRK